MRSRVQDSGETKKICSRDKIGGGGLSGPTAPSSGMGTQSTPGAWGARNAGEGRRRESSIPEAGPSPARIFFETKPKKIKKSKLQITDNLLLNFAVGELSPGEGEVDPVHLTGQSEKNEDRIVV